MRFIAAQNAIDRFKNTIFIRALKNMLKRISQKIILLLVLLLFAMGFYHFGKWTKKRWIVYITLHSPHWQERSREIEMLEPGKYKVIFLGNSLTELFYLDQFFKDTTLLNCGIVGDFTEGLLQREDAIIKLKPEKLFIEIGINDMIEQISLDEICTNYRMLIERIQKESPSTHIFIQSNLPVVINRPSLLRNDKSVNEEILCQNQNLRKIAREFHVQYIDLYTSMIESGRREDLFIWDGIHLTPKAYGIWARTVLPYIEDSRLALSF
jgi:lysophospholipase L1-like esterase